MPEQGAPVPFRPLEPVGIALLFWKLPFRIAQDLQRGGVVYRPAHHEGIRAAEKVVPAEVGQEGGRQFITVELFRSGDHARADIYVAIRIWSSARFTDAPAQHIAARASVGFPDAVLRTKKAMMAELLPSEATATFVTVLFSLRSKFPDAFLETPMIPRDPASTPAAEAEADFARVVQVFVEAEAILTDPALVAFPNIPWFASDGVVVK